MLAHEFKKRLLVLTSLLFPVFLTWFILGTALALSGIPNTVARKEGQECVCPVRDLFPFNYHVEFFSFEVNVLVVSALILTAPFWLLSMLNRRIRTRDLFLAISLALLAALVILAEASFLGRTPI